MKSKLLIVLILVISKLCFSQDVIVLNTGDEIKSKVVEILETQVKYKKFENLDGPIYTILKSDVFMIKYVNGTKDVFADKKSGGSTSEASKNSGEEKKKAEVVNDLKKYVEGQINREVTRLEGVTKTNATSRSFAGQEIYIVMFNTELEFIRDGWLKGNDLAGYWQNGFYVYGEKPDLSSSGQQYMYGTKLIRKGLLIELGCEATFENTENGYVLKKIRIKTVLEKGNVSNKYEEDFIVMYLGKPVIKVVNNSGKEIVSFKNDRNINSFNINRNETNSIKVRLDWKFVEPCNRPIEFYCKYKLMNKSVGSSTVKIPELILGTEKISLPQGSSVFASEIRLPLSIVKFDTTVLSLFFTRTGDDGWVGANTGLVQFYFYRQRLVIDYKGDLQAGIRKGRGKALFSDSSSYDGFWENDKMNGEGTLVYYNGSKCSGVWKDDEIVGKCKCVFSDKTLYEGEWKNDQRNGQGEGNFSDGSRYKGDWVNDLRMGKGEYFAKDSSVYSGDFVNNKREGRGILKTLDGSMYDGNWKDDKIEGFMKIITAPDKKGNQTISEGVFHDNTIYNGTVTVIEKNGKKYIVEVKEGVFGKAKKQ